MLFAVGRGNADRQAVRGHVELALQPIVSGREPVEPVRPGDGARMHQVPVGIEDEVGYHAHLRRPVQFENRMAGAIDLRGRAQCAESGRKPGRPVVDGDGIAEDADAERKAANVEVAARCRMHALCGGGKLPIQPFLQPACGIEPSARIERDEENDADGEQDQFARNAGSVGAA